MKFSHLFSLLALVLILTIPSCKDDDNTIIGCTDSAAENYNADATESDNSCVYAREKFLGDFMGTIVCGALITEPTDFTMVISESLVDNSTVQIEFKDTSVPFPIVTATVEGDQMVINKDKYNIEYQGFPAEVEISGDATITENNTKLDGTLAIAFTSFPITDNCSFSAEK